MDIRIHRYPFTTTCEWGVTTNDYEVYQNFLQTMVVDLIDYSATMTKMRRRWGSCPDLQMASDPQAYYETSLAGITEPHKRRPTRGEMLLQNWTTVMRGGKGVAPFEYQCAPQCDEDGEEIWISLIDNLYDRPFEEATTNQVFLTKKQGDDCISNGNYVAEEGYQSEFDGDAMFTWQAEFFGPIEAVDNRLKGTEYSYANGLYDVDVDTFRSIRGDMSAPLYYVRQITVTPPGSYTKSHIYTELSIHHSSCGDNLFILFNRSIHLTGSATYQMKVAVPWGERSHWSLVDLITGTQYSPESPQSGDKNDEMRISTTLPPAGVRFFILKYDNSSPGSQLVSNSKQATGFSNGRKLVLSKIKDVVWTFLAYTDINASTQQPHIDYAASDNNGESWDISQELISNAEYPALVVAQNHWPVMAYVSLGRGSQRIYNVRDCCKGTTLQLRVCSGSGSPPSIAIYEKGRLGYVCHVVFYDNQSHRMCHYIIDEDDFNSSPGNPTYELKELYWPNPAAPRRPTVVCDSLGRPYIFFSYEDPGPSGQNGENSYIYYWDGESKDAIKLTFAEGWDATAFIEDPAMLLTWVAPAQCTWPRGKIQAKRGLIRYEGSFRVPDWSAWTGYEEVDPNVDMGEVQPMGANAAFWQSQTHVYFSARDQNGREPSNPWTPRTIVDNNAQYPQSAFEPMLFKYATAWTKGTSSPYSIEVDVDALTNIPGGGWNSGVHLISPNGGERYYPGDSILVIWSSSYNNDNFDYWRDSISTDSGSTWTRLRGGRWVDTTGNRYVRKFKLPNLNNSSKCLVKVSYVGGGYSDVSDRCFRIGWYDPRPPDCYYLMGVQPPGTKREIYWEQEGIMGMLDGIKFQYSLDNGNTWNNESMLMTTGLHSPDDSLLLDTLISEDSTDTAYLYKYWGTIEWEVPNAPTSAAKIRLTAYDTLGDTASRVQDSSFIIPLPGGWSKNTWANQEIWGLNEAGDKMELFYVGRNPSDTNKPIIYNTTSSDGYSLNPPDSFGIGIYPCHQRGLALWLSRTKDTIFSSYWDQAVPRWSTRGIVVTGQLGMDSTHHSPIGLDIDTDTIHAVFGRRIHRNIPEYDRLYLIHVAFNRNNAQILDVDTINIGFTMSGPEAEISPSVQSMSGKVVVAYQKNDGSCWFAQKLPTGQFSVQQVGSGRFPVAAISEGNITYSYLSPDAKSLIRLWRYVDDTTWNGRDTFALDDSTTFMTGQEGILYGMQIKGDTISKTYLYDPLGKRFTLRATRDGSYLHSFIRKCDDDQWTECYTGNLDTFRFVKTETYDLNAFYPALYQEAKLKRSPYTLWRDTCITYDSCVVDSGADSLKYQFNRLNTSLSYNVMVELYFESDDPDTHRILAQLGSTVDTIEVPNNTFMWHYMEIPSRSSSFTLKLYRLDAGDFVSVSRLVVGKIDPSGVMLTGDKQALDPNKITFCLYQPFPNPFSDAATIRFALPYATNVSLKVYDVSGRLVNELVQGKVGPGIHTIRWEGKDNVNRKCASGVYFVRFVAQDYVAAKKMVMIK